ncbi:MAG TPA: sigma-54 dependent transcriptional regulator [Planctomycetaceae bacterium]|nr:sigma-54 dependent transcriptional regulator [Planctomycetaceae bacterium]
MIHSSDQSKGPLPVAETAIAFVRDVELYEQLERRLADRFGLRIRYAGSAADAIELLSTERVPLLLLDTRIKHHDPEVTALCQALVERALPAVNVITVGDEFYPRAITAALSLVAVEHLPVYDGRVAWDAVGEKLPLILTAVKARPIPSRKSVEAGGIRICTWTPEFFPVVDDLLRVAHRDVTLLLVGETGTGKTTLAQFIHHRSPRRDRAFQHLACGALPGDLIESELFGHTRGAFTGAERNKIGRFQAAGRGTLLLDEIDVLDLKQQVKLLRVIETGEFEIVGATETRLSEARLIVASNVDLDALMEREEFRSDLYYRLNMLEFRLLALRDRPLDIAPIALQFIDDCCAEHSIPVEGIERGLISALKQYRWPGNLRELKNHMRRLVLFCEDRLLRKRDLSPKVLHAETPLIEPQRDVATPVRATMAQQVAHSEREILEQALAAHGHNRTRTAEALGLSRVGLYKKLKRLGLMGAAEV